jgi:hypothetical protein
LVFTEPVFLEQPIHFIDGLPCASFAPFAYDLLSPIDLVWICLEPIDSLNCCVLEILRDVMETVNDAESLRASIMLASIIFTPSTGSSLSFRQSSVPNQMLSLVFTTKKDCFRMQMLEICMSTRRYSSAAFSV